MSTDPNSRAARAERWRQLRPHLPAAMLEAHDRQVVELRETRRARREADLKAKVDEAVRALMPQALAKAQVLAGPKPARQVLESETPAEPAVPLHELSVEAWGDVRTAYWREHLPPNTRRPMTVSELIAGRREDDGPS